MAALSDNELARYARQLILPEVDLEGQARLKQSRALVIGAGGLGCRGAQSTCTNNQYATLFQPRLPLEVNLGQDQLTCVACQLIVA